MKGTVIASEGGTLEFYASVGAAEAAYEVYDAEDDRFEFFLADGSRLVPRVEGGRFTEEGTFRLGRATPPQDCARLLRELMERFFRKYRQPGSIGYERMSLQDLVEIGLREFPG